MSFAAKAACCVLVPFFCCHFAYGQTPNKLPLTLLDTSREIVIKLSETNAAFSGPLRVEVTSNTPFSVVSPISLRAFNGMDQRIHSVLFTETEGALVEYLLWNKNGFSICKTIDRVNLRTGAIVGSITLPGENRVLDISRDGRLLVTKALHSTRINVWSLMGTGGYVMGFIPFDNISVDSPPQNICCRATFVGHNNLLLSMNGLARLVRIPEGQVIWTLEMNCDHYAVSPDRKLLAIKSPSVITLVDIASGKVLGEIGRVTEKRPDHRRGSRLCFSPNGTRLAVVDTWLSSSSLSVLNLETCEAIMSEVALPNNTGCLINWIGDGYLLLGGTFLFDLEKCLILWEYSGFTQSIACNNLGCCSVENKIYEDNIARRNGTYIEHDSRRCAYVEQQGGVSAIFRCDDCRVIVAHSHVCEVSLSGVSGFGDKYWYVSSNSLAYAVLPHVEARKKRASLTKQEPVFRPGSKVTVDDWVFGANEHLQREICDFLRTRLEQNGFVVTNNQSLRVRVRVEKTLEDERKFVPFFGKAAEVRAKPTSYSVHVIYERESDPLWDFITEDSNFNGFAAAKENGKTLQQSMDDEVDRDIFNSLQKVPFPRYIYEWASTNTCGYGTSLLTTHGVGAARRR